MGARVRAYDWKSTPLGPLTDWPAWLRSLVGVCLNSPLLGTILWGPELRMIYNDAYAPSLQDRHPHALGRPIAEVWGDTWSLVAPQFQRAMTTGEGFAQERVMLPMVRQGQTEMTYWNIAATPIWDEEGRVAGLLNQGTEITEAVFAEKARSEMVEALQASKARQVAALSIAQLGTFEWSMTTDAAVLDQRARQMLCFSETEGNTAQEIFDRIHPEDAVWVQGAVLDSIEQQSRLEIEYRVVTPDDAICFIKSSSDIVVDAEGDPLLMAGVLIDNTQTRSNESSLRASERRLRFRAELGDAMGRGVAAEELQAGACRLLCDHLAASRVYYAEMEADGERVVVMQDHATQVPDRADRYRLADFPAVFDACRTSCNFVSNELAHDTRLSAAEKLAFATLPVAALVIVPIVKNGHLAALLAVHRAAPCLWSDGEIALVEETAERIWVAIEKLRAEQRLNELNATLQERIATALADHSVTEEALRQAQKMEAVGQLTGGVAHDFNNLLTVIKSSTELLKRPNLPEDRRSHYVAAIATTVDRAAKLTGQLLAFARRQALKPEVFAACDSVRAIKDMISTLSGPRIQIVVHLPEVRCFIHADPSQFDTALVNMAVNARDAMAGEGQLTLGVRSVDQMPATQAHPAVKGSFVAVSLADTGTGIPTELLAKIFEPFYTTKGVGQGTGLGLSQVYGFAMQSGGEVMVTSKVGEGSIFTLYLPQVAELVGELDPTEPDALVDGHGTCVLVVEDNLDVGAFTTHTLAELGYHTVWAVSAEKALEELDQDAGRFDVVFSDVVMPGMNGIDLAHEIDKKYPDLPVLLASGYSQVLAQSGSHGFELLHKPYSIEQLSRVLRQATFISRRKQLKAASFKISRN